MDTGYILQGKIFQSIALFSHVVCIQTTVEYEGDFTRDILVPQPSESTNLHVQVPAHYKQIIFYTVPAMRLPALNRHITAVLPIDYFTQIERKLREFPRGSISTDGKRFYVHLKTRRSKSIDSDAILLAIQRIVTYLRADNEHQKPHLYYLSSGERMWSTEFAEDILHEGEELVSYIISPYKCPVFEEGDRHVKYTKAGVRREYKGVKRGERGLRARYKHPEHLALLHDPVGIDQPASSNDVQKSVPQSTPKKTEPLIPLSAVRQAVEEALSGRTHLVPRKNSNLAPKKSASSSQCMYTVTQSQPPRTKDGEAENELRTSKRNRDPKTRSDDSPTRLEEEPKGKIIKRSRPLNVFSDDSNDSLVVVEPTVERPTKTATTEPDVPTTILSLPLGSDAIDFTAEGPDVGTRRFARCAPTYADICDLHPDTIAAPGLRLAVGAYLTYVRKRVFSCYAEMLASPPKYLLANDWITALIRDSSEGVTVGDLRTFLEQEFANHAGAIAAAGAADRAEEAELVEAGNAQALLEENIVSDSDSNETVLLDKDLHPLPRRIKTYRVKAAPHCTVKEKPSSSSTARENQPPTPHSRDPRHKSVEKVAARSSTRSPVATRTRAKIAAATKPVSSEGSEVIGEHEKGSAEHLDALSRSIHSETADEPEASSPE